VNQTDQFWQFNIGHLITIAALLVSFWSAHHSNRKRIEQDAADRQEIKTKLDMIYSWFQTNIISTFGDNR
jgi:hypothetical protein